MARAGAANVLREQRQRLLVIAEEVVRVAEVPGGVVGPLAPRIQGEAALEPGEGCLEVAPVVLEPAGEELRLRREVAARILSHHLAVPLDGLVVAVGVGWLVFRGLLAILPKRLSSVALSSALAAFVSVPVTALAFVGLFAIGGQAPVDLAAVTTAMVGWHVVIGLGEAAITGVVISSVLAARPDLVYGARGVLTSRPLEIRTGEAAA